MSTEITNPETFEQKLKNRIKDSIGDLISNEDLSKLVHRGVEEIFFQRRPNPKHNGYSSNTLVTIEPLLHELVRDAIQPAVVAAVETWVQEHHTEMMKVVDEVVKEGVGTAVLEAMNRKLQDPLMHFQGEVYNKLMQR